MNIRLVCLAMIVLCVQPASAQKNRHAAFVMTLGDNWEIGGQLPTHAFLISLQGLANRGAPRLYFLYPTDWPYGYTRDLKDYIGKNYGFSFEEIRRPEDALHEFRHSVKGYVVWDTTARTSLTVAFTVAGLEQAVVVSPAQIAMVEREGLKEVEDFRGKFAGKTDYEIYRWALDRYWPRCNHQFLTYMGGVAGKAMQPGVADFGIYHQSFFTDLSCDPRDTLEYSLVDSIMGRMRPFTSFVLGWHSYAKDLERMYITLISKHVLRQEGLNTWPNMSFVSQLPLTPGFKFRNQHHVAPGQKIEPGKKVYVACVQTDGLGLGAWLNPERGTLPYAWEVADGNSIDLAPALLEYFYTRMTPNDYFIGALSGPSYMYPGAIPARDLSTVIGMDRKLMKQLDLRIYGIMDRSREGDRYVGNNNLPERIVNAYYHGLPEATGFLFGYGPGQTYDQRHGVPFLSYEYYLSPKRPEEDVVADLKELAVLNPQRPYYLLIHVRESSKLSRVGNILKQLGPDFEMVPLDVLVNMAGEEPTFKTRYFETGDSQ